MSLYTVTSKLLAIKPRVWIGGDALYARTALFLQALSLFSCARHICVDRRQHLVKIETRWLWFIHQRRIVHFKQVSHIDLDYGSVPTAWNWWYGRTDEVEKFTVSVVLKNTQEKLSLCSFMGDASIHTGWGGVLFGGDTVVDWQGDQEDAFQRFVSLLPQFLIDVPVGKPLASEMNVLGYKCYCTVCGRSVTPNRTECPYCGGIIQASYPRG